MKWYIKVIQNYANFEGRARRKEYWMFVLFNALISIAIGFVDILILDKPDGLNLSNIYSLALLLPTLAVGVRRMHDLDKSGWYLLIPFYNFILSVTEGDTGTNEYGDDPKDEKSAYGDLLDN